MRTKLHLILFVALIGSSLLAACGSGKKSESVSSAVVTGVRLETVRLQPSSEMLQAVGTIQSINTSVLSAQIGGTIREMRVKAGDRVRRGEVLALLDDRAPQAQLDMAQAGVEVASQGLVEMDHAIQAAQANLQFAHATYERYQGLLAKNSVSRQEFDDAQTRYKAALANEEALEAKKKQIEAKERQARSERSSAETLYSYSRILSPLNGVVVTKAVDVGTVVMPGAPLLTVEDDSRYRLEVSVPEDLLGRVELGHEVAVALPEGDFKGRVAEIVPAADPASRTFIVKVNLPQDCHCRSGEYGKATLPEGVDERLLVPRSAVAERGELEGVFVANENGILQYRLVKTGRVTGKSVEILSGLSAGERVATSKVDQLQDGMRVEEP
jgi:multidrug efflux system membrane fusion protein